LVAGALVLVGGVAGLLGVTGVFAGASGGGGGGVPVASGSGDGSPGAVTRERAASGGGDGATGGGGTPTTGGGGGSPGEPGRGVASAGAETRQAPRSQAPTVQAGPVQGGTGQDGATREGGAAEPGMVAGTTTADDVLAGGPDPADGEGYKADGPSRHTDQEAARYFRANWGPGDKAMKRLRDIRTVGGYLRIYTDLPETADNSLTAITLCERGLAYMHERGVADPVVFVQAEFGGNGNPVLANILGRSDRSCRVTHPAPG
ncbi:hypothetical protein AB0J43_35490, partial [Nonomuraea fuscirosea]